MKSGWQKYLLYASIVLVGGFLLFETIRLNNTGFEGKSLWDWMELLIIPAVLAIGAILLNRSEKKAEREIATDRQQEAALQSYFDRMTELLLKEKLGTTRKKEVRNVARTRTLTVLRGLDGTRKGLVIKFLQEAGLISDNKTIVSLHGADLSDADLSGAKLNGVNLEVSDLRRAKMRNASFESANLKGTFLSMAVMELATLRFADLSGAYLSEADLSNADLIRANLSHTHFSMTNLSGADLSSATLFNANLSGADLSKATLFNANLSGADLSNANLLQADLSDADLRRANISLDQLKQLRDIKGATMPDETRHE